MKLRTYETAWPHVHDSAYVDNQASVIGDVVIGPDSSVWPMAVIRGDVNHIRIGARTNIQDGSVVHVTHPYPELPQGHAATIGDDVTVGHRAVLHGCAIGNECLIGIGAVILDGAVLQDRVLLGAGSLVTEGKILESGYLYVGSPARQLRELTKEELKWFKYSAQHYVKLKNDYLVSG
jgi:carbonic anhydrase/acetyltransferase-like protein (isoleucine patch superfamily)